MWARQMCREPRRCLNCQQLNANHLAARCMCREVCGTCGDEHRMAKCTETNHNRFRCTNCNMSGHTSWDCLCPRFLEECGRIESSDPEHTYKYFPNQEAWTWEQVGNEGGEGPGLDDREQPGPGRHRPLQVTHSR